MPVLAPEQTEDIIARWLSAEDTDDNNPAGPLYLGGSHTIADITATGGIGTITTTTIATTTVCGHCSGSQGVICY